MMKSEEESNREKPEGHLEAFTGNILNNMYLSNDDFSRNLDSQKNDKIDVGSRTSRGSKSKMEKYCR